MRSRPSPRAPATSTAGSAATWTSQTLWVLVTTWEGPGAYRRALSSYDVKLHAVPVLGRAVDEPGAYEIVDPDTVLNVASTRSLG